VRAFSSRGAAACGEVSVGLFVWAGSFRLVALFARSFGEVIISPKVPHLPS
jgi:hypothetical protein